MRSPLLAPVSWLYGIAIAVRNWLYECGAKKVVRHEIPIVCVGNITVGGTGKTPMCELLIDHFRRSYNVALLSRGYGRRTKGYLEVDERSSYRKVGDEPRQIKDKFPDITVAVCENRNTGVAQIQKHHPEVNLIVMDDGLQYRALDPKLHIVMVDYTRPMDCDRMLPWGDLRDSPKQLRRAHYVVVTKCPPNMSPLDRRIVQKRLDLLPFQSLHFTRPAPAVPHAAFPEDAAHQNLVPGSAVVAMAAIGNPAPFVDNLREKYTITGELLFPDHHPYTTRDLRKMEEALRAAGPQAVIVTTEKDVVKLGRGGKIPPNLRAKIYVQPMRMTFVHGTKEDFFKSLDKDVRTDNSDGFFFSR